MISNYRTCHNRFDKDCRCLIFSANACFYLAETCYAPNLWHLLEILFYRINFAFTSAIQSFIFQLRTHIPYSCARTLYFFCLISSFFFSILRSLLSARCDSWTSSFIFIFSDFSFIIVDSFHCFSFSLRFAVYH